MRIKHGIDGIPKKVVLGDITVRDGFQHEEKFIPTDAKLWVAEQLVLAGFKRLEITNFGSPKGMPQFKDADELMKRVRGSKKVGTLLKDVELTAITIRERAVERAIQARREGYGSTASFSWCPPASRITGSIPACPWPTTGRCASSTSLWPMRPA